MNDNYSFYKAWAPEHVVWSRWAKPVLFSLAVSQDSQPVGFPVSQWTPEPERKTALIVDLPGEKGVLEGLVLAQRGYCPVPLYNGVYISHRAAMTVDVTMIVKALHQGAGLLATLAIPYDAPPVFLLDSNRMRCEEAEAGKYDNRWCVFPQDMPSADFLLNQGIRQIYVRTKQIQNDLSHILLRYQEKGIRIFHSPDSGSLNELTVVRPSLYRSCTYRFQTMLGLTRNAAGGFGGMIPEATQSSGTRHYGVG